MRFTKMHGLGNDYLYVFGEVPDNVAELSKKLSNRRFGVGSDGMIFISESEIADYKMRIFNADGSEAKMCGNGIRCVGKYLFDNGYVDKTELSIETLSGNKILRMKVKDGKVFSVAVEMGTAVAEKQTELCVEGNAISVIPVSVGNPHAVIFVDDINSAPLTSLGPKIEKHSAFANRTNVEFVEVISKTELRMRVWERGSGVTMACGTGACASVAAAISCGFCQYNDDITVYLDGGTLTIKVSHDNNVTMIGCAEYVFEGEVDC